MYEVGQILFVILNKRPQIIPVQVIEQVVRRSLKGEEIQYSVNVPTKDGEKVFDLSGLDGVVYDTLEEVQEVMLANAALTITKMIDRARAIAKTRLSYEQSTTSPSPGQLPQGNGKSVKITLDDGVVANVVLPDGITGDSL